MNGWRSWIGGLAMAVAGSCAAHGVPADAVADVVMAEARWPAVRALVSGAEASPAMTTEEGHVAIESTRLVRGRWRSTGHGVAVQARADGSAQVTADGARFVVRRLDGAAPAAGAPAGGSARVERGVGVTRDAAGRVTAFYGSRASGVEELAVMHEATAPAYAFDLPEGWSLVTLEGAGGVVEVRDARALARVRMSAPRAWDARGDVLAVRPRVEGRVVHLDVEVERDALPALVDPEWRDVGSPIATRGRATVTLLPEGKALIVGGEESFQGKVVSAIEQFDALTGRFESVGSLKYGRADHTAVLLRDGRVLIMGGFADDGKAMRSVEVYDPHTGTIASDTLDMKHPRARFSATLLEDDRVMVAGGALERAPSSGVYDCPALALEEVLSSVEVFEDGDFAENGGLEIGRADHTATLLPDGRVLIIGGQAAGATTTVKATETWKDGESTVGTPLLTARRGHVAVLLADGDVLVAGGVGPIEDTERTLASAERLHAAGGVEAVVNDEPEAARMREARAYPAVAMLPDGQLLIAGGELEIQPGGVTCTGTAGVDLFVPGADGTQDGFLLEPPAMPMLQAFRPALVTLPTGRVLLTGNADSALLYDPGTPTSDAHGDLALAREAHTATLLPSGRVLLAGGDQEEEQGLNTAEVFDRLTDSTTTYDMLSRRSSHTATLLPDGRVLLTGGYGEESKGPVDTVEIFAEDHGFEMARSKMGNARLYHTATSLPDGSVLICGGGASAVLPPATNTCDLFSADGKLSAAKSMKEPRLLHTATLLPNGKVLVAGGEAKLTETPMASTELYDPLEKSWEDGPPLPRARSRHTATLLAGGSVLFAGGSYSSATSDIYDPMADKMSAFSSGPKTGSFRAVHTAVTLPDGRVALVGGRDKDIKPGWIHSTVEVFDPAAKASTSSSSFYPVASLDDGVFFHTTTLLPTGEILVAGGAHSVNGAREPSSGLQLLRVGPVPHSGLRPILQVTPSDLRLGDTAKLTGQRFTGIGEGTGGAYPSPSGFPIPLWLPDAGMPVFGRAVDWSADAAEWTVPMNTMSGFGLLFVTAHGAAAEGRRMRIAPAENGKSCQHAAACLSGACEDGVCCDTKGCGGQLCMACSKAVGAPSDGSCAPVGANTDDKESCPDDPQCEASGTGVCNGTGQCVECPQTKPARCSDDDRAAIASDDTVTGCGNYLCRHGDCLTACTTKEDCAPDLECDPDARCVGRFEDNGPEPSCATEPRAGRWHSGGWWLPLSALLLARARRRRTTACTPA